MKTSDDIPPGPFSEHELQEQWNQQADEHSQWGSLDSSEQLAWAQLCAIAWDRKAVLPTNASNMVAPPACVPSDIQQALVDAESALADIAEGHARKVLAPLEWAEGRAFRALGQIRLVMRGFSVRTSERPTVPPVVKKSLTTATAPPADGEVAELVEWLVDHAAHLQKMASIGALGKTELPERLNEAAELLERRHPAPVPLPEGEVGELVDLIRQIALAWEPDACLLGNMTAGQLARAADLLAQRHPAPVPVSERLPQAEDCDAEGRCWWYRVEEDGVGEWFQRVPCQSAEDFILYRITHWLPFHALPLPAGEVRP